MCGRAVQTLRAAKAGAEMMGIPFPSTGSGSPSDGGDFGGAGAGAGGSHHCHSKGGDTTTTTATEGSTKGSSEPGGNYDYDYNDNYNMSPGMDAWVIWKDEKKDDGSGGGTLRMDKKVWGLVTKGGTQQRPLFSNNNNDKAKNMSMHFQNLMFNARSDTLYSKPTFSRLAANGKSCIIVLDGFFEWKAPLVGGGGKKQPYFVHPNTETNDDDEDEPCCSSSSCLVVAGLWTQVPTGNLEQPTLDTFTILTTEANEQLKWLHHRMPVCIWDINHAHQWLDNPSCKSGVLKVLEETAQAQHCNMKNKGFSWYMVTTEMNNIKFRGKASIQKVAPPKSVSSFFKATTTTTTKVLQVSSSSSSLLIAPERKHESTDPKTKETPQKLGLATARDTQKRKTAETDTQPHTKDADRAKKQKTTNGKSLITTFFQKKN